MLKKDKNNNRLRNKEGQENGGARWLRRAHICAHASVKQGGSPHPAVQVGAVLVGKDGKEIASASNRFAEGVDTKGDERYDTRTRSLWINCAEQMVIAQAVRKQKSLKGAKLYVSLEPCAICAGLIAECGIEEIFVPERSIEAYKQLKVKWKRSIRIGRTKLKEAGVKVTIVADKD